MPAPAPFLLTRLLCLASLLGAGAARAASGQDAIADASGVPMLTRFNAEHYDVVPQHSTLTTDATGRVYAGNVEGLLLYSAGRFQHLRPEDQDISVRSVALAKDGRAIVAGYDQFGAFTEQADGRWTFTDLDERFRDVPDAHPIGQVWLAAELPDGLYFVGERRLFRLGRDGQADSWATPDDVLTGLRIGDEIWVRVAGRGLMRFDGQAFVMVPGGETFKEFGVQSAAPHPKGTLFSSRVNGLYLGSADTGLRHVATDYDDWMRRVQVYAVAALPDGDFALATLSGEVAIVDPALKLKKLYRISNYPITDVAASVDGGLWFSTEGDLVRMEWPSPWTFVGEDDGLFGALNDAEWFEGRRWVATSLGLFRSVVDAQGRARFEALPGHADEVWDLQRVGDDLLVGERKAVLLVEAGQTRALAASQGGVGELIPSSHVPGRVLALESTSILELEREPQWHAGPRHDLGDIAVSTLVELDAERWLIGDWRGYPHLVRRREASGQTSLEIEALSGRGMQGDPTAGSSVFRIDERIYAALGDDLYEWRDEAFVARPDHPLATLAGDRLNELEIRGAAGHAYAFTSRNVWVERDGHWQPLRMASRRALGLSELSIAEDGRLTVVAWGGLLTYDPRLTRAEDTALHLRMHRVTLLDRARQSRSLDRRGIEELVLPPLEGLRFEYGIDGHDSAIEYRTLLDGGDGTAAWSDWAPTPLREFNRLAPGAYRFRVEARTRGGRSAAGDLDFRFRVEPRWYQTRAAGWAAAGLVLLLGSLLAWAWGRYRSRQLQARNVELEREIAAHTRDLEIANQRLSRLAVQDGLTGITNRRGFEQFYQRAWNRLAEQRQPLAVLMVDVDFFKQYNDQHGHLHGDEMLRGIAQQLEQDVREPEELLARFGGEEFVIVLPGTDFDEATTRAHALRARCETFGKNHDITVSVGVAACVPRGGLKSAQLLDEADAALYRAKKLGRNRVERGRAL